MINFNAHIPTYQQITQNTLAEPDTQIPTQKITLIIDEGGAYTTEVRYSQYVPLPYDKTLPAHCQTVQDTALHEMQSFSSIDVTLSGEKLWIDKYYPKEFSDLITDDRINRDLMTWLMSFIKKLSINENTQQTFQFKPITKESYPSIIIYGPTSSGKSSLANIAASKCGFEVLTINSFEDQESKQYDKIITFMENISIFQKSAHKCIIIEGIEYQHVANISKLCSLLKGKIENKKKIASNTPFIFICDDIHAKCLKQLKLISFTFYLKPPQNERILSVISRIANNENIAIDFDVMRKFVENNRNDLRGCINNMQIISKLSPFSNGKKNLSSVLLNEKYYKKDFKRVYIYSGSARLN